MHFTSGLKPHSLAIKQFRVCHICSGDRDCECEGAWLRKGVHGAVILTMESFSRYHLSHFDTHSVMLAPFVQKQGEMILSRKVTKDDGVTHRT